MLILNKKAVSSQEAQLFKTELEKFWPHRSRISQANHKQSSLMKELTRTYNDLLQDKRVRGEQNKYETFSRQRNHVLNKYRKVYQAYCGLQTGLDRAQQFYGEMKDTVESLNKNVEGFVENRRSEGGQLLTAIEAAKGSGAEREQARMKELMERMSISPSHSSAGTPVPGMSATAGMPPPRDTGASSAAPHRPPPLQPQVSGYSAHQPYNPAASPPITPRYQPNGSMQSPAPFQPFHQPTPTSSAFARPGSYATDNRGNYNPNNYGPVSPPAHQQYFSPPPSQQYGGYQQPSTTQYGQPPQQQQYGAGGAGQNMPPGWQPPPPPPGPPPGQDYGAMQASQYPSGPGGYAADPRRGQQQQQQQPQQGGGDPWAGLSAWK